jgi:hypothetical protein
VPLGLQLPGVQLCPPPPPPSPHHRPFSVLFAFRI